MITRDHAPNMDAIKERMQKIWICGEYARIGNPLVIMGETLWEVVDLRAGNTVLDVATGSGNTAISAARRFCEVTGVDYVPALIEHARKRAEAEGMEVSFEVGDAEELPYPDASFDVALSTIGIMFAPNQEKAASELLWVCRSRGKIGLASWTPDGFIGQMFRTVVKHVPPPPEINRLFSGVRKKGCGNFSAKRSPRSKQRGAALSSEVEVGDMDNGGHRRTLYPVEVSEQPCMHGGPGRDHPRNDFVPEQDTVTSLVRGCRSQHQSMSWSPARLIHADPPAPPAGSAEGTHPSPPRRTFGGPR